jgi:penicillin-binding protein 1A
VQPKTFWTVIVPILVVVLGGGWYLSFLAEGIPSLEELENPTPPLATKVYSVDGEVIDKFFEENRSSITSLDSIPPALIHALIATEDTRFYEHWGVDLRAVIRIVLIGISNLSMRGPGGSTITQQLAKNLFFSPEVSLTRKFREWMTAAQIERHYTKDEILMMYLNVSAFGRGAYGIQTAAQIYFSKVPSQLTTSECAFLVGLLKAPTRYDPRYRYERAVTRRNVVLRRMADESFISESEYGKLRKEELVTKDFIRSAGIAPHFVEYVRQLLREKAEKYGFNLYRDGLSVYTTLDTRMQEHANSAVSEHLEGFQKTFDKRWNWNAPRYRALLAEAKRRAARGLPEYKNARDADERELIYIRKNLDEGFVDSVKKSLTRIQVGFMAIEPQSGFIKAMVGNSELDFRYGLNHCTQIQRQPGSTFKPFVYTVAIDNGYSPAYELPNDVPAVNDGSGKLWRPRNFDGSRGGTYTLRRGLMKSVNLIAIRTIMEIAPPDEVVRYAHRMGIESVLRPYPSLAIGTSEVVPMEIIAAYGAFANEGIYAKPTAILRIEDRNGRSIEINTGEFREVLSKQTAFIVADMMRSVVTGGTAAGTRRYFAGPAAGKTGTTQDYADAWFIGYTPNLVAGVWTGFDDRRITFTGSYGQGSVAAAPIWGRFMKATYGDKRISLKVRNFIVPEGVGRQRLCLDTQNLATRSCPRAITEWVNDKYIPGLCTLHIHGGAPANPRADSTRNRGSVIEY